MHVQAPRLSFALVMQLASARVAVAVAAGVVVVVVVLVGNGVVGAVHADAWTDSCRENVPTVQLVHTVPFP